MSEPNEEVVQVGIWIAPTEADRPPRAVLFRPPQIVEVDLGDGHTVPALEIDVGDVTWSRDLGAWVASNGQPVAPPLGDLITQRAKDLGVEW